MSEETTTNRASIYVRGMKHGVAKGAVDNFVKMISGPISEAITAKLAPDSPALKILQPAVETFLAFIIIAGTAEAISYLGPMMGQAVPSFGGGGDNVADKSQKLAHFMRNYAGERIGEEMVNVAISIFPLVMEQFSAITSTDLDIINGNSLPAENAKAPSAEHGFKVVQQNEPAQVLRV